MLLGLPIGRYHGVDLSRAALDLAEKNLAALDCPVKLEQRDFVEAVNTHTEPEDIVWIGLSLHHFPASAKLDVMRRIRGIVGDYGHLIVYEPASPMTRSVPIGCGDGMHNGRRGRPTRQWRGRRCQRMCMRLTSPRPWTSGTSWVGRLDSPRRARYSSRQLIFFRMYQFGP